MKVYSTGPVASLVVKPETEVTIENGSAPTFFVEVLDAAGNITSGGKISVVAKVSDWVLCQLIV